MRKTLSAIAFLAAVLYGPVGAAQTPASTWTIPGTVNAGGLNNTRFVSDLAVTNPGSVPVQATISFIPVGGTTPKQVTLGAGQTLAYRNVLDSLWGAQGAGATQVACGSPLLIRARTYNTAATGTYGVALPVFADDRLLVSGKSADSLWISQSADGGSGFRTNIAVVFPDAGGGAATVTIYGADGNEVSSQDFAVDSAGFQQFGVGGFAGAVSVARAEVQVTRGRAAGYSVVVDNVTGDSSLFTFEELPNGYQDVVANGVARANGRNNTFFRTDGRFFNPSDEDAVVQVSFHAAGLSNPSPVSSSFTVGAGRILEVTDLLDVLLGLPVGSAGALRFETDAPVAILCRTSNVDPLGVKPGTFGAQQRPTPLLSFVMSADAGAAITGIRQNSAFRTNVGFAAGAEGADYALTLKNADGATIGTASGSLGAFGWAQPNVQDLFPATAIPDDATLHVKVNAGSVDVFDSSIDNTSGDPVVTPIMPLPVSVASSATIGPQGGSVRSADGRLTLKVPAGALSGPVAIAITPEAIADADAFGPAYSLTPSPLPLAKPALLVFRASDPAPDLGLVSISLAIRTASGTFFAMGGRVDPAAATLSVPIASTNPSAPSVRAARNSSLAGGTLILSLKNLAVGPLQPAVLTDGSVRLHLGLLWPPSAGVKPAGLRLELSPEDLKTLVVLWKRPTVGKIVADPTNVFSVTYVAPHRVRAADFFVGSSVSARAGSIRIVARYQVEIVRRDWVIETDFTLNKLPCDQEVDPFEVSWHNFQTGKLRINDGGSITLTASSYQYENPVWALCPARQDGCILTGACVWYKKLTPDPDGFADLTLELSAFSAFDLTKGQFTLDGNTNYYRPGAQLSGGSFPYVDFRVEPVTFPIPLSLPVRLDQERVWFKEENGSFGPYFETRHRIYSVDAP
ncbi:MAG: hypothetical protein ABI768_07685 [Acidobacteriota bacterium]